MGTLSTIFIVALFILDRNKKQPSYPSTKGQSRKMLYIYTMEYFSTVKNNDMKFPRTRRKNVPSEVTDSQKDKHNI